MKRHVSAVVALAAAAMIGGTVAANATDLEVMHWWTSKGESAAVSQFAKAFDNDGHGDHWIDSAIAGGPQSRAATMQRILGGDPPGAAQFNPGRQYEDLIKNNLLLDLTPLADKEGWNKVIRPPAIAAACHVNGHWWCVPVNIHSWNWAWVSLPVLKKSGVPVPNNVEEFLKEAPKIKAAGFIPFAIGGEPWQIDGAFTVIQTAMLGHKKRDLVVKGKDLKLAAGPEMKKVFETFKSLKQYSDPGSANRNWNDTTNLLMQNKAALQIMGDWARGEFSAAGLKPGVDYGCIPGFDSAHPTVTTDGDIILFPKQNNAAKEAAQLRLASLLISPKVQVAFNNAKGSMPVRPDVDMSTANACMKKALQIIKDPSNIVESTNRIWSPDTAGQMDDLIAQFWADDSMTVDQAQAKYVDILKNAD